MPIDIKIPPLGESITEAQISEWLKSEGDIVNKDENVAVIDSEKATLELTAPESGRLTKILHPSGETVKVGQSIAQIEPEAAEAKSKAAGPDKAGKSKSDVESNKPAPVPDAPAEKAESKSVDSGYASGKAEARPEPDDHRVKTSVISREDKPVNHPPVPRVATKFSHGSSGEEKVVPMTVLRRTAARRLVEAKQQMAMLTTFNEADMSTVLSLRKEHQEAFEKRHQARLGFMSFFVAAAVEALKQYPQLNAEIRGDDVVYRSRFDLGVAIASERGLVVPVLRNAGQMSFPEIEIAISDLARRAKDGKLKPEELAGGTFTITNGGVFGSLFSTPIVNPPQSGILGMHAIQERPVAVQGQVVIRPMMYLALTYDHRLVDGREAVLFLRRIKEIIESPVRALVGV